MKDLKDKNYRIVTVGIIITSIICISLDFFGRENIYHMFFNEKNWWTETLLAIMPDDTKDIQNLFEVIWGVAITIVIFMIELGGTYIYGITFKWIIEKKIGDSFGIFCIGYLLLCPGMFIFTNLDFKITSLWILIIAFGSLLAIIHFSFKNTRVDAVRSLIKFDTRKCILDSSESQVKKYGIKNFVDALILSEMIEHVDYNNTEDTWYLLNLIQEITCDKEIKVKQARNKMSNSFITCWVSRIIAKIGLSGNMEKQKVIDLFYKLYYIFAYNEHVDDKELQSYTLQILIPFIRINTEDSIETMLGLWRNIESINKFEVTNKFEPTNSLTEALLFYTHFHMCCVNEKVSNWVKTDDKFLKQKLEELMNGKIMWDSSWARSKWSEWCQFDCKRSNIKLEALNDFEYDIRCMKAQRIVLPKTKLLQEMNLQLHEKIYK